MTKMMNDIYPIYIVHNKQFSNAVGKFKYACSLVINVKHSCIGLDINTFTHTRMHSYSSCIPPYMHTHTNKKHKHTHTYVQQECNKNSWNRPLPTTYTNYTYLRIRQFEIKIIHSYTYNIYTLNIYLKKELKKIKNIIDDLSFNLWP